MEPIVSAWFIYILSIVDSIDSLIMSFMILGIVFSVLTTIIWSALFEDKSDQEQFARFMARLHYKRVLVLTLFLIFAAILFPSRNTLITMYVADNITMDNINKVGVSVDNIREIIKGDVIDILEAIGNSETEVKND